ncbi:MAG TPA: aconitase X catalytic domain-containing protein [Casimicrobiaceae bacterium]|nr:aconitase X catalytic domain-containing protein [Casimicrobiaceae bacterium]
MRLSADEQSMVAGELGSVRREAIEHQIRVGRFFGARDFVAVTQAHVMADTESLGEHGVRWLEKLASHVADERRVRIPTITDPRGTDFAHAKRLGQVQWMLDLEQRAIAAFVKLGVLMTDTCINYQTIAPAIRGEHVAFGDTGVVIYTNSVCGARSNFEGGPSALAAALTGRTPRYGFHLDEYRLPTLRVRTRFEPQSLDEWGALGGIVGQIAGNYWSVPIIEGIESIPSSDALKHFGAAMASFGSVAMFHLPGITPEASSMRADLPRHEIDASRMREFRTRYAGDDKIDVVVFSAPQLSLFELEQLATLCDGRRFAVPVLAVTSPQIKPDADRMGLTSRIEAAGGTVLSGMCFYQSYAREMAEANGWKRLATNSAKMTNILGGYGYRTSLLSMEACIDAAQKGRIE